ncbi:acyltransferase family protein [Cryobacterium sp. CG_9.6]|uniref:acyltransferase family protein n=1 Tax=Cryobacterium sp. CG_9.6 TaxID=2760710 RepID=UPI002475C1E5|nr:acyltransferase family protein [Cryobacterium sp. CG_9.6]MDH6237612.1 fucose 4-O-acetylase-like acetyltransferase [Cryobacterium sp. CG_9.6]
MSAPHPATTQPAKRRVPLWDNARWITVTLVVVGHAILKLIGESDTAYAMYLFIYAFHVPVFVAVSGYFAKSDPPGTRQLKRLLTDIIFPYVIFETVWTCIRWVLGGTFRLDYSTASWTLWFLLALVLWRIILPYLVLLRYPLLISIVLSLGAGYSDSIDSTFALSRTIGLLPFFVFGWKLRQWQLTDRWLRLRTLDVWKWRTGALALFTSLYLLIAINIELLRTLKIRFFLLYDDGYSLFGYPQFWAGGVRLGFVLLTFALILAFLMLIPRRETWFTSLGAATMYIYLLHTFVLFPLRETGILDGPQPAWVLPALIVLSVLISVVLSLPPIRRIFQPLVEPRASWLFQRTTTISSPSPSETVVLPRTDRT